MMLPVLDDGALADKGFRQEISHPVRQIAAPAHVHVAVRVIQVDIPVDDFGFVQVVVGGTKAHADPE